MYEGDCVDCFMLLDLYFDDPKADGRRPAEPSATPSLHFSIYVIEIVNASIIISLSGYAKEGNDLIGSCPSGGFSICIVLRHRRVSVQQGNLASLNLQSTNKVSFIES